MLDKNTGRVLMLTKRWCLC